jgi:Domain of unknown function (DUF4388)
MHNAINKFIPTMSLPDLTGAPTHEDLVNLLRSCDRHGDKYVLQSWMAGNGKDVFMLRVLLLRSGPEFMRLKREGKAEFPEWAMIKGDEPDKNIIWAHATRDIGLLLNLIAAETGEQVERVEQTWWENDPAISQNSIGNAKSTRSQISVETGRFSLRKNSPQQQQPQSAVAPQPAPAPSSRTSQTGLEPVAIERVAADDAVGRRIASGVTLAGDIRQLELQNVLQSIGLCKMSGALLINNDLQEAALYFNDGEIVDATIKLGFATGSDTGDVRGDHAFLEVLTWENGSFSFDQQRKASNSSITRKSYALLMEGVMLRDYCQDLNKRGIDLESRFTVVNPAIEEEPLRELLKQGLPLDAARQKSVMERLSSGQPLYELLKQEPLPKAIWVPIIFNLLGLNLIKPANEALKPVPVGNQDVFQWEESLVSTFHRDLIRPDTGMCADGAFFYFINRELLRFKKTGRQFWLLLFQVRCRRGNSIAALTNDALRECATRFSKALGELDLIGQNNMLDFGILLLGESIVETDALLDGCAQILSKPLLPGIENIEQLQATLSLYSPEKDGRLTLKQRKTYPQS